jgi:hypothetical protein
MQLDQLMKYYNDVGCTKGAENCNHPADCLIGNNVAYNLSFRTLEQIFKMHGAVIGYFSLILPDELLIGMSTVNTKYRYTLTNGKKTVMMNFTDGSWGYTHDKETWHDWATKDVYEGLDFNLLFERYRAFGNMWVVRVTRITKAEKIGHMICNPFTAGCTAVYNYIPHLHKITEMLMTKGLVRKRILTQSFMEKTKRKSQKWLIPTEIVTRVIDFAWNRKDNEIDRIHVGTMLVSNVQKIMIAHYSIQNGFHIQDRDFGAIAENLFMRAMIARANSTKETGYFIRHLQQLEVGKTTWAHTVKHLWNQINPLYDEKEKSLLAMYGISKEHFLVYQFLLGQDEGFDLTITEARGHDGTSMVPLTPKDITFDPWGNDGLCINECIKLYTNRDLVCHLGKDPLITDVERHINSYGFTVMGNTNFKQFDINFDSGHATVQTSSANVCEHFVSFEPLIPSDHRRFRLRNLPYDATKAYVNHDDAENYNVEKTTWVINQLDRTYAEIKTNPYEKQTRFLKSKKNFVAKYLAKRVDEKRKKFGQKQHRIINMCAAPFNDRTVWEELRDGEIYHNIVRTENVNHGLIPYYPKNHKAMHGKNAACLKCMIEMPATDLYYADIGNNIDLDFLPMYINEVLINALALRTGNSFRNGKPCVVIKIRRFTDMLKNGRCGTMMMTIRQNYHLLRKDFCAPDEVLAVNWLPDDELVVLGDVLFPTLPPSVIPPSGPSPPRPPPPTTVPPGTYHYLLPRSMKIPSAPFMPIKNDDGTVWICNGFPPPSPIITRPAKRTSNPYPSRPYKSVFDDDCDYIPRQIVRNDDLEDFMPPYPTAYDTHAAGILPPPYLTDDEESYDETSSEISWDGNSGESDYEVDRTLDVKHPDHIRGTTPIEEYYTIHPDHPRHVRGTTPSRLRPKEESSGPFSLFSLPSELITRDEIQDIIDARTQQIWDSLPSGIEEPRIEEIDDERQFSEVTTTQEHADIVWAKLSSEVPNMSGLPVVTGKLYHPMIGDMFLDYKEVVYNKERDAFITDCDIYTALQLTQKAKRIIYSGSHLGKTWRSEGGIFNTSAAPEENELELYVTPFHPLSYIAFDGSIPVTLKRGELVDGANMPSNYAIIRSDIPNITFELTNTPYQIVDDFNPCPGCKIPTFYGIITDIHDNHIYGPTYKLMPQPFTAVTYNQTCDVEIEKAKFIKELKDTKGTFADLHTDIARMVSVTQWKKLYKINIVEGTYGSGKTTMAIDTLKNIVDIAICPTKNLADEYTEKGIHGFSWSTGIIAAVGKKVLIDEIFNMDPRAIMQILSSATEVYAIGDRDQMKGGGKTLRTKLNDIRDIIPLSLIKKRMVTISTPHDCVEAINVRDKMDVKSMSRVVNSVTVFVTTNRLHLPKICKQNCNKEHQGKCNMGACFDLVHANQIKYPTVATIQGLRAKEFHLFLSPSCGALIHSVHGQRLVAISRHTEKLNIYANSEVMSHKLGINPLLVGHSCRAGRRDKNLTPYGHAEIAKGDISINPEGKFKMLVDGKTIRITGTDRLIRQSQVADGNNYTFKVPLRYEVTLSRYGIPSVVTDQPKMLDLELIHDQDVELTRDNMRATSGYSNAVGPADAALVQLAPTSAPVAFPARRHHVQKHRTMKPGRTITLQVGESALFDDTTEKTNIMSSRVYGQHQENNGSHMLHTVVERYAANERIKQTQDEAIRYRDELIRGFDKFVDCANFKKITVEQHSLKQLAALQKICAKSSYPDLNMYGEDYASTDKTSGFNKKQLKAKIGEETWLNVKETNGEYHVKGGQSVSAEAKTVNEILMPYVLFCEEQVMKSLRPGVFFGYGTSKTRFRRIVQNRLQHVRKHKDAKFVTAVDIDITEQETTKNAGTILFYEYLFRLSGAPEEVIKICSTSQYEWLFHSMLVKIKTKVQNKSGTSKTLPENTCHGVAEVGRSFKWSSLKLALFQGDDAHLRGVGIELDANPFKNLKISKDTIGEFISFIVTDEDLYLDIPRIAAKALSREFKDAVRLEELRIAMQDLIALHPSAVDRYKNQRICAYKYKCDEGLIMTLYEYIVGFATQRDNNVSVNPHKGSAETVTAILTTLRFSTNQNKYLGNNHLF